MRQFTNLKLIIRALQKAGGGGGGGEAKFYTSALYYEYRGLIFSYFSLNGA